MKKTITIVIPTYKEEDNVIPAYNEVRSIMVNELSQYDYEIMFVDNDSPDKTRLLIKELCKKDNKVKAIFYARNFGQARSHFYGLTQAQGDCAVLIHADLQNPPSVIPSFVKEWENGAKVVVGIKDNSKENRLMFHMRSIYYKLMSKISDTEQIEHFSDFELLDKDFLNILRNLNDPLPYLRGIVSELGFKMKRVHYSQNNRIRGKTSANWNVIYDFAMLGITSYTKSIMRLATKIGFILSFISMIIAVSTFIMKLINWDDFSVGVAATSIGVWFLGSVQLFFIGFLGEYVLNINTRVMNRPLVVEQERINF